MLAVPAAVERRALVAAPTPTAARAPPCSAAQALHRHLVRVDVDARVGAVAPQHGDDVARAHGPVEDPASLPARTPRRRRRTRPRGIRWAGGRPALAATEGERHRPALTPRFASGQHRDAGGIETAAEMHAHGVRAAQTVPPRPARREPGTLPAGVVGGRSSRGRPLGTPVPFQPRLAALDGQRMAGAAACGPP